MPLASSTLFAKSLVSATELAIPTETAHSTALPACEIAPSAKNLVSFPIFQATKGHNACLISFLDS